MFARKRKEKSQPGGAIIIIDRAERMVVSRRKMWNHYSTCNDDDFLGPLCRNCQFCILSRYHRTHYKSQTPTASHPCPPGLALQCSPGGWCPLVPSPPCVGNSKGTGHLRQTTVASSSSNFRPKIVFIINWCYKRNQLWKITFIHFSNPPVSSAIPLFPERRKCTSGHRRFRQGFWKVPPWCFWRWRPTCQMGDLFRS